MVASRVFRLGGRQWGGAGGGFDAETRRRGGRQKGSLHCGDAEIAEETRRSSRLGSWTGRGYRGLWDLREPRTRREHSDGVRFLGHTEMRGKAGKALFTAEARRSR